MTMMRQRRQPASSTPRNGRAAVEPAAPDAIETGGVGVMALSPAPSVSTSPAVTTFRSRVWIDAPPEQVFAFHADVHNLPRLTPGPVRIISAPAPTAIGDLQVIELGRRPLALRWQARITRFEPPSVVTDEQERGPFRVWLHSHTVVPAGRGALLVDAVQFALVGGRAGRALDAMLVVPLLRLLFAERHRRTRRFLESPGR